MIYDYGMKRFDLYRMSDGGRIGELLGVNSWSYQTEWCDEGKLELEIMPHTITLNSGVEWQPDYRSVLRKWATIIVLTDTDSRMVEAAGVIKDVQWDGSKLAVTCGDGWSLWDKRLVLNHDLAEKWVNGNILVDEDNPAPEWHLRLNGASYEDIAYQLVNESLKWGTAPYVVPTPDMKATFTREYFCWDFATVLDRLQDLTELENGAVLGFKPIVDDNGFHWLMGGSQALGSNHWRFIMGSPIDRFELKSLKDTSEDMVTQAFGVGGKTDDHTMVAMNSVTPPAGMPVLQSANKTHDTVTEVDTLVAYLIEDTNRGGEEQSSVELSVAKSLPVLAGDVVTVTVDDVWLGVRTVDYKVLEVSDSSSDTYKTLGVREVQ